MQNWRVSATGCTLRRPGADSLPSPVPQFDFTSCQGVLFVLLMTLFFSGLLLAILLPFQYVSLTLPVREGGGDDPVLRVHALLPLQGHPGSKPHGLPPCPALLATAPCPQVCWQHRQANKEAFLGRPGHLPSSRSRIRLHFPSPLMQVEGGEGEGRERGDCS